MTKQLSEIEIGQILALIQCGHSYRSIAKDVGRSKEAIRMIFLKFTATGSAARRHGSGRPCKTTARVDAAVLRVVRAHPRTSCCDLHREFEDLRHVSLRTIQRRIVETGEFQNVFTRRKPFINTRNRAIQVQWARDHLSWTREQWRRVLWSDESPFVLRYNRRTRCYVRVWAPPSPEQFTGTIKHDAKLMVWGCFAAHGVGRLYRVQGLLEKHQFLRILMDELLPSVETLFPNNAPWIFQQDNDPKHTALMNQGYLRANNVNILRWPSQSPDLNPIENLWSILDMRLKDRNPQNLDQLFECLQGGWAALPVSLLESLADSMPVRCQAVINSHGYPTKY